MVHPDPPSDGVGVCRPWRMANLPPLPGLCFRGVGGPQVEERAEPRGTCTLPQSPSLPSWGEFHLGFARPRILSQRCSSLALLLHRMRSLSEPQFPQL